MNIEEARRINEAGSGFMATLTGAIQRLEAKGYTENIVPRFDHFECRDGKIKLSVQDFQVDEMMRFENTSDPDDQAIMYAITSASQGIKGLYVDSYGLYHDNLSQEMIDHLRKNYFSI